jgi:hypothetical protein
MNRTKTITVSNLHRSKLLRATATMMLLCLAGLCAVAQTPATVVKQRTFATARQAADALIQAAEKLDDAAVVAILGPDCQDVIHTGEPVRDREMVAAFVAQARVKQRVAVDRRNPNRAILSVGIGDWPFPLPIVRKGGRWFFDTKAGRHEILMRRIGSNELDAIQICNGFVEAQHEYALMKRQVYQVNQYAQRIISTPGQQDGLAWKNTDGTWGGPIGESIARAIERGYTPTGERQPFHGYYFKVLKGQGPAAPLGQMDFVVKGLMIGGFALVASPAEYGITGVKSFMVSHDGVVYEKDLGKNTLEEFNKIERFNPDKSWRPVQEP